MKTHYHLIKHAIKQKGFNITVDWGDCKPELVKSTSANTVKEYAEASDECCLIFRDSEGNYQGSAYIILENHGEEVADYSDNDWLNVWNNEYLLGR